MAKAIMIQGTGSHVGKSTLVTALCRIFSQDGYRVAPFKAQNMALNSYITREGYEMGRAQAVQAFAAGVEPQVEMNPILLKATSDQGAQVILSGKVVGNMKAREYQSFKQKVWEVVKAAYAKLERSYDLVVIEGAGSPAEINLKKHDIANMRVARMAKGPVILVGDIDRGGIFASLIGTLELLTLSERSLVAGFVINKFRGDFNLLTNGLKFLERKTRKPVFGVLPYLSDFSLEEEDGVALDHLKLQKWSPSSQDKIKMGVIYLPHISNFTDFDPLKKEPDVELFYVRAKGEIKRADVVILPGSKNTIEDLMYIRNLGLDQEICQFYHNGGQVIGICGGVQMLGRTIQDPLQVESRYKQIQGLDLLGVETVLETKKITAQVQAKLSNAWRMEDQCSDISGALKGYELHMGRTRRLGTTRPAFIILKRGHRRVHQEDGALSMNGRVWGTYLHGLFENDSFRKSFLDRFRFQKGWIGSDRITNTVQYDQEREWAFDHLAQVVRKHLDLKRIYELF
jgi:adenosylcobyric acid synthase